MSTPFNPKLKTGSQRDLKRSHNQSGNTPKKILKVADIPTKHSVSNSADKSLSVEKKTPVMSATYPPTPSTASSHPSPISNMSSEGILEESCWSNNHDRQVIQARSVPWSQCNAHFSNKLKTQENQYINPRKAGSLKRHQRLGGGADSAPPWILPFGFFFDIFFDTILETYINEEPMQRIGSLAFKFWMWWPPKDWYPRSDF